MSDNQDARWIKAFRMQAAVLQELDDATVRRERIAVRKILRMEKAAHVLPVGLIQLTDFASDIMVIVQIATTAGGAGADWIVCAVAVGLSLLVAWVYLAIADDLSSREKLIGCVLACANLHVLYVGTRYISALYEGRPSQDAAGLYSLFVVLKMFETGIESVVLGMVTAGAFVRTLVFGGAGLALFASSLALSLLSMAYGFFGQVADLHEEEVAHRRPAVFVCILVHLCWGLAAFGALAAATAGAWWLLGVGAMLSLAGVRCFLEAKARGYEGCGLIGTILLGVFMFGLPLTLVDFDVFAQPQSPRPQSVPSLSSAVPPSSAWQRPPSRSTPTPPSPPCSPPSSSWTSSARRTSSACSASSNGIHSALCWTSAPATARAMQSLLPRPQRPPPSP